MDTMEVLDITKVASNIMEEALSTMEDTMEEDIMEEDTMEGIIEPLICFY
jgi:hypothetical protein